MAGVCHSSKIQDGNLVANQEELLLTTGLVVASRSSLRVSCFSDVSMSSQPLAKRFQYCPSCGASLTDPGANPLRCECGFVFFFGPVTAVGAIVADEDGRVLFIRRANEPGKGKLGLPGGFVDPQESLEVAVAREVREETGLEVVRSAYLTSAPNLYCYRDSEIDVTDMFFVCRVASFESLQAVDGEAAEFLLREPGPRELDAMAFDSNRKALEVYLTRESI